MRESDVIKFLVLVGCNTCHGTFDCWSRYSCASQSIMGVDRLCSWQCYATLTKGTFFTNPNASTMPKLTASRPNCSTTVITSDSRTTAKNIVVGGTSAANTAPREEPKIATARE